MCEWRHPLSTIQIFSISVVYSYPTNTQRFHLRQEGVASHTLTQRHSIMKYDIHYCETHGEAAEVYVKADAYCSHGCLMRVIGDGEEVEA